jgi:hypothetical protein
MYSARAGDLRPLSHSEVGRPIQMAVTSPWRRFLGSAPGPLPQIPTQHEYGRETTNASMLGPLSEN